MALSPQWLDELKSRITLSTLIQRTVKLQRAGREWKACCPFHSENTPSFYVNDQKGFYHCFGCQQHGGAIDWMMEQHGLPFMDAVKELASEAGMEVPAPDPRAAQRAEQRATLHDVMAAAQEWFVAQLATPAGQQARAYLERRGLNEHTIRRFGFGWAPDDKQAIKKALEKFDERLLIEAGLLIEVEDKVPYSRFRGRVMLPIQDARERVIAFGGRILQDREGVAKYLNSPDTPLFDKGRTLYNLHRAASASRKTDRVIVAEGYMDVIALAAAGIEDAVAPMGTALTEQQIELLWRMADKPVLCFDGDKAGTRAAMRAAERALPLLRPGHSLRVVQLPTGLDPDDLIKRDGRKGMDKVLEEPKSLEDVIWEHEKDQMSGGGPADFEALRQRLKDHAETVRNRNMASAVESSLLGRFFHFRSEFSQRLKEYRRSKSGLGQGQNRQPQSFQLNREMKDTLRKATTGASRDMLTAAVLNGLARHPGEIHRHADALLGLSRGDAKLAQAVNFLLDRAQELEASANSPISGEDNLPPAPDNTRFSFLMEGHDPDEAREDLAEAVALLVERPALEAAIAEATRRFDTDPEGAFAEQQRLRKRKLEIDSRLGQMARKRAASEALDIDDVAASETTAAEQETD